MNKKLNTILFLVAICFSSFAQQSVARLWNETELKAIRVDYARPTVHARNLFHVSAAMFDAWSVFDAKSAHYLLGNTIGDFTLPYSPVSFLGNTDGLRDETISYAAYRLLVHRFKNSPGALTSLPRFHFLFDSLGYDSAFVSTDYTTGSAAALGNYIAQGYINYGLQDGANEANAYTNLYYYPVNDAIVPTLPGNAYIKFPNKWQPITFDTFVDQSGNVYPDKVPSFLSPEWGNVSPFALTEFDKKTFVRNNKDYNVFHDPGTPPLLKTADTDLTNDYYKWGFELVSAWGSHLDTNNATLWDISPATIGNNPAYPTTFEAYKSFYKFSEGGDASRGHAINPKTNLPYTPQLVKRGDFARVLAEFWADGPHSETPPGHWFTILNYVSDHKEVVKKYKGEGALLSDLEWDVKAYFTLGGAVHDAAVTAWGIKGWYDYVRPISAIRYMCDKGQSTSDTLPLYHEFGVRLIPGFIELVDSNDALAGADYKHLNKIKLNTWRGPNYVGNPKTDVANAGWILGENWWPYQRPTFVTPPFAGYISGHSTFSRAAAEVLTQLTGDAYFPGGLGEFEAKKNEFLVFEEGPTETITLQWATYKDASDQTSLSRIWGGIHPPADDIPGRIIGEKIGDLAFATAERIFNGWALGTGNDLVKNDVFIYPNYSDKYFTIHLDNNALLSVYNLFGKEVFSASSQGEIQFGEQFLKGVFLVKVRRGNVEKTARIIKL